MGNWFVEYSSIISKTHPQNTLRCLFCLICEKPISIEHQGKDDLDRYCTSKNHLELLNSKTTQKLVKLYFVLVCLDVHKFASSAEVKVTGFLTEQNFSFPAADHLGPLFRKIFPHSKTTKAYVLRLWKNQTVVHS